MITLSSAAAAELLSLVRAKGLADGAGLRLAVEKGGCAGMQYSMSMGEAQEGDLVIERDGARLFVDAGSLQWLDGCEIDYEDGLSGAGFRVRNPQAARSCGCGTSFEPTTRPNA